MTENQTPEIELAKGDTVRIGKGYQLWTVDVFFKNFRKREGETWVLRSDPGHGAIAGGPQITKPLTDALRARLTKVTPEIHEQMINTLDRANGY